MASRCCYLLRNSCRETLVQFIKLLGERWSPVSSIFITAICDDQNKIQIKIHQTQKDSNTAASMLTRVVPHEMMEVCHISWSALQRLYSLAKCRHFSSHCRLFQITPRIMIHISIVLQVQMFRDVWVFKRHRWIFDVKGILKS